MNSPETAPEIAKRHGLTDTPRQCLCKHKWRETGAIFYQSLDIIECANCRGFQLIEQPIK